MYVYFEYWQQYFGNILSIRRFSKSVNVVEDFANTLGVTVELPNERTFERIDTSESLLRAIYNNRSPEEVLPNAFDQAFKGVDLANAPSISRLAQESFSFDQTDAIVAEQAALFERIKQSTGLDLLGDPAPVQKKVDADELRNRALEHVLQIVMDQADRIRKLERAVTRLRNKVNKP